MFGLLATALVTDVIQLATGYHAPFFLTVCQPNYTAPGVSCDNNAYITQDICMGKDQYAIMSARWDVHASFLGEFRQQIKVFGSVSTICSESQMLSHDVQSCSVVLSDCAAGFRGNSPAYQGYYSLPWRSCLTFCCTRATAALRLF